MSKIPPQISHFIQRYHVLSLACSDGETLWAANCFYAFEEAKQRLIILSQSHTLHAQLMQRNALVVGTIAAQPKAIIEIEGIQFQATAKKLDGEEKTKAQAYYLARHSEAKGRSADVWGLYLNVIKYTENRTAFGHKVCWQAADIAK